MNRTEKETLRVIAQKKELVIETIEFLSSAVLFIVETGRLAEFWQWQAREAKNKL